MAETLTRADVERIAALARLELTPDEVTLFAGQLTAILAYADQVQQVDTSSLPTVALPTVALAEVGLPAVALAEVGLPAVALADVGLPAVALADVGLPAVALAKAGARDDAPAPSLDRDLVLNQAPAADRAAGIFKVPRVLGS